MAIRVHAPRQRASRGFDGITIYFPSSDYSLITNAVAPIGWDLLVIQPDAGLPADGFLDLLHIAGPLIGAFGPTTFSDDFNYLGANTPGAQRFELYGASPFAVVLSSQTQSVNIPEPSTLALIALAFLLAASTPVSRTSQLNRSVSGRNSRLIRWTR